MEVTRIPFNNIYLDRKGRQSFAEVIGNYSNDCKDQRLLIYIPEDDGRVLIEPEQVYETFSKQKNKTENYMMECPLCNNTGEAYNVKDGKGDHPYCKCCAGRGWIEYYEKWHWVTCYVPRVATCRGSGHRRVGFNDTPCEYCNTKGVVPSFYEAALAPDLKRSSYRKKNRSHGLFSFFGEDDNKY